MFLTNQYDVALLFFVLFNVVFLKNSENSKTTLTGGYVYTHNSKDPIGGHGFYDPNIIDVLRKSIPKHFRIADFGAGLGHYTKALRKAGLNIDAFDGAVGIEQVTNGVVKFKDLALIDAKIKKYDLVISFEVGEHIPAKYEENFIKNILKTNATYIILSWAIPGQKGYHHVNNKPNSYIKSIMSKNGYNNDLLYETFLRDVAELRWFKNTIMCFIKNQ